jgi:hypothetical protein
MGLETGTTISSLITSNPVAGDAVSQGDDHLRLIKGVLQAQFPGAAAGGFAIPITATEAEINQLHTNEFFKTGTKVPFYQASPPVGWTAATVQIDSMMRIVAPATTAGTYAAGAGHSPILMNVVPAHTHNISGTTGGQSQTHVHANAVGDTDIGVAAGSLRASGGTVTGTTVAASADHTHAVSGTSDGGSSSTNWQPRYMDFCVGSKT